MLGNMKFMSRVDKDKFHISAHHACIILYLFYDINDINMCWWFSVKENYQFMSTFVLYRYIRAEHYLYEFTKFGGQEAREGKWWSRRKIETYLNPVSMKDVKEYLRGQGWKVPRS